MLHGGGLRFKSPKILILSLFLCHCDRKKAGAKYIISLPMLHGGKKNSIAQIWSLHVCMLHYLKAYSLC
jgi:hypothetical protein